MVIDDFESSSEKMTLYIREQLADLLFDNNKQIKIVTREHMGKIEKELDFQNSGKVSVKSIISVAERIGAHCLVFGSFEEENEGYIIKVRMLDVKTGIYLFRKTYSFSYSKKIEQLLGRSSDFKKVSTGISGEINKNSLDFFAIAAGLTFDICVTRKISLGSKILCSYDFLEKNNQIVSTEFLGTARYYFVFSGGVPGTGIFAEVLAGADFILVNSELNFLFSAGAGSGYRFAFSNIYFEPSVRFGYPYILGVDFSLGFRF